MAKPLANGYPIGAVLMRDSIATTMTAGKVNMPDVNNANVFTPIGTHGTTFGGSPMACAVGHHVLTRLSSTTSMDHVQEISAYLDGRLESLTQWFPDLIQNKIRGRGLLRGLGFNNQAHPGQVVQLARERGVLVLTAGADAVRLVPSLNVEREEVDMAVDVLEGCLTVLRG